jgi:glycosyltransferase involved in cell wall biosynthesis
MTGDKNRSPTGGASADDPLHVLSIIHSATFGGPHNQALQLHRVLAGAGGARLTVVLPDEPGDAAGRLRAAGVAVIQLPLLRPRASRSQQGLGALATRYPGQILRLRRLIREEAVDVVEVHGLLNVDGAVAGRLAGRGVIWQLIDTRPPPALRWLMMPVVLMLADLVMTTGRAVAHQYPGAGLRPSRLVPFVPPVAPVTAPPSEREAIRSRTRRAMAVADRAVLVASVGNLNPQKGYESLIEAVAACRRQPTQRDLQLRIRGAVQAGHEAYAEELRLHAVARGLAPETVGSFEAPTGPTELMMAADLFALASRPRSEGLPTVVLEAMAVGVPVAVTDIGSIAEVVHDEVNGLLVRPDDPVELTRAIGALAGDATTRQRLGKAGRVAVHNQASPETFAHTQMQAYARAARRHRRPTSPAAPKGA